MRSLLRSLVFAALVSSAASAQRPAGADSLSSRAVSESLAVLRMLETSLRSRQDDATLWHRRGLVAWALAIRASATPALRELDARRLNHLADTSLRLAVHFAPRNASYQLAVGQFLLDSPVAVSTTASREFFDAALVTARAGEDLAVRATAAGQVGFVHWLRYETYGRRRLPVPAECDDGMPMSIDGQPGPASAATSVDANQRSAPRVTLRPGRGPPAVTEFGMKRLRAAFVLCTFPIADAGEADYTQAEQLFREAYAARLFAFRRLLNRGDSIAHSKATVAERAERERQFWMRANPLWSREGDDAHTEFLARVVYTELRWTIEARGVRGADSDRGEFYIRYGPPDTIGVVQHPPTWLVTYWYYDNGNVAAFWSQPMYGTARYAYADDYHIGNIVEMRPVSFDNVAMGRILAMPVRFARFRAPSDSVDIFVATRAPLSEILAGIGTANTPVRADGWLSPRSGGSMHRDSSSFPAAGIKTWIYRVPAGIYSHRAEATADGSLFAARALSWITADRDTATGFALRGFGMSDMLLAIDARPSRPNPARWDEFGVAPLIGALPRNGQLALIWENYELGARAGQAQYSVNITVERQRSAAGRIVAEIVGAVAGAVGIDRQDDRVVLRFDRTVPHARTVVDNVAISLRDTPPGTYRLTLEIVDQASGRRTHRTADLDILR